MLVHNNKQEVPASMKTIVRPVTILIGHPTKTLPQNNTLLKLVTEMLAPLARQAEAFLYKKYDSL
jgi:hypothetical protein